MSNDTLLKRLEQYLEDNLVNHAGREEFQRRIKTVANKLGNPRCSDIDPKRASDALAATGVRNTTVNRYATDLKKLGITLSRRARDQKVSAFLSGSALSELDSRVRADRDDHCKVIYCLMRDGGMRGLTEWRRFDWGRVNWSQKTFVLESRKGTLSYRIIPMTDRVFKALCWWYSNQENVSDSRWRAFWSRVRLGPENVPYDLRHTFCTRLLDAGVEVETVSRIMGHSSLDQTMEYVHTTPKTLRSAAYALDRNDVRRDPAPIAGGQDS